MEEHPQTTDSGSSQQWPNHKAGAEKRADEFHSRNDQEQVMHQILVDLKNLQKQVDNIEKDKVLQKLDLPPELANSIGIDPRPRKRLKRGLGARPLLESEIKEAYEHSITAAGAARYLGVGYDTLKKHATKLGLWKTAKNAIGVKKPWSPEKGKYPLSEILEGRHPSVATHVLREKLFRAGLKERKCEGCGFSEKRITDNKQPLVLNFIDENSKNHNIDNLQILCYNCIFMIGRGYLNAKMSS
jgi:hypothetical protein